MGQTTSTAPGADVVYSFTAPAAGSYSFRLRNYSTAQNPVLYVATSCPPTTVLAAANRDPEGFPDPDRLDLTRAPNRQVGFGIGPHYCLGAPLARAELEVALHELTRRLPGLHLAGGAPLTFHPNVSFRGPRSLPVAW